MTPTISPEAAPIILKSDVRGRVRLPKERQAALLEEFEKGGMSAQAFAAWAGVKYPTFASVQKRRKARSLDALPAPANPMRWAEAVVAQAPTPGGMLVIYLPGGVRVEASSGRQAAEFVAALGAGRC